MSGILRISVGFLCLAISLVVGVSRCRSNLPVVACAGWHKASESNEEQYAKNQWFKTNSFTIEVPTEYLNETCIYAKISACKHCGEITMKQSGFCQHTAASIMDHAADALRRIGITNYNIECLEPNGWRRSHSSGIVRQSQLSK